MSTGTTTGTASILDMAAQQDELDAILAAAPPLTPAARELLDRARDEAVRAARRAVGCEIRIPAKDEPVPDGIGADLDPGDMYGSNGE
jgi:hypothetical protein